MSHVYYPAVVDRGPEGFGISFPDFPGCVSAGTTIQETVLNGEDALKLHLYGMAEDGDMIPTPSSLDSIEPDPEADEVAHVLIRADLPGKKVRVNVVLDEGLISAIDAVASNRSRFIDHAVRAALTHAA